MSIMCDVDKIFHILNLYLSPLIFYFEYESI